MGACWPNAKCKCLPMLNCCFYERTKPNPKSRLLSKWMEILHKVNPEIKLNQMSIPGTHDSATYSIPDRKCLSSAAKTQRLSLYEQLNHGVRFLDVRYGGKNKKGTLNDIRVMHGPFMGNTLMENLKQIRRFLDENPKEFVIARFKEERSKNISDKTRVEISEAILEKFKEMNLTESDVYNFEEDKNYDKDGWFNIKDVTLDDILRRKKRILVLGQKRMFRFIASSSNLSGNNVDKVRMYMRKKGFFFRNDFFINKWHKKNRGKQLYKSILANIEENESKMLFNSQFTLTLEHKECCDFVRAACCLDPVRIDQHVRRLYYHRNLQKFFELHIDKEWNFCWFDYFDYDMDVIHMLVGRNFKIDLDIIKATYSVEGENVRYPCY